MLKKVVLFLFVILIVHPCFSQKDTTNNLLYYVAPEQNQDQFLVPFIETTLRDLVYAQDSKIKLYKTVNSLNLTLEKLALQKKVLEFYSFINAGEPESKNDANTEFSKALRKSNRFLKISVKDFGGLLEYEFIMYNVIDTIKNKSPKLEYYSGSSVFIDPRSLTYKSEIIFAIKQVCDRANKPPVVSVKVNAIKSGNVYCFAPNDTIRLGAMSIDYDSPSERLVYQWKFTNNDQLNNAVHLYTNTDSKEQLLTISEIGSFTFFLSVFDGISQSNIDSVAIKILPEPRILSLYSNDTSNVIQLYHRAYCLFEKNEYDTAGLTVVYASDTSAPVKFLFDLKPIDSEGRLLTIASRTDSLNDSFANLVLRQHQEKTLSQGKRSTYFQLFPEKTKVLGNYALYVTAVQNGMKGKPEMRIIQYMNILPFHFSFDLNAACISKGASLKRSHFISYIGLEGQLHIYSKLNLGFKTDISCFHGTHAFLDNYRFLRNTNVVGGVCFPVAGIPVSLYAGGYQFPTYSSRNPGGEISIAFRIAEDTPYIKFGYTMIRGNEQDFYHCLSLGYKFYYQPIRSNNIPGYGRNNTSKLKFSPN